MTDRRRILVTGGAGFIGSALCRHLVRQGHFVVNVDKLTYAGHLASLKEIDADTCICWRCHVAKPWQINGRINQNRARGDDH